MSKFVRVVLVLFSLLLSVFSVVLLTGLFDVAVFTTLNRVLSSIVLDNVFMWIYLVVLLIILGFAVWAVSYAILSGRLSRTRIRQTDIGTVDIGVDAIESIALNSAKSAQVGIKSAKAHVF